MIVSNSCGFVFLHVPKNAGTAFRNALQPFASEPGDHFSWGKHYSPILNRFYDASHIRTSEYHAFPWLEKAVNENVTIAFARDPILRFISAFNYYNSRKQMKVTLDEFIQILKIVPEAPVTNYEFTHFCPQHHFLFKGNGKTVADHILDLEDADSAFSWAFKLIGIPQQQVSRVNEAAPDPELCISLASLSQEHLDFLNAYYAKDFDMLGYEHRKTI